MPTLKLEIYTESLKRLTEIAGIERRPIQLQAEVLLLKSLGRWPIADHPSPGGAGYDPAMH
jgi:hypothetical protein